MASSSKTLRDEVEEEERDWLELGLGFGSAGTKRVGSTTISSPFETVPQQLELKLGLGLGFVGDINGVTRKQGMSLAPPVNHHHHQLDMPSSSSSLTLFTVLPQPSLSSWAPSDTLHHYSRRSQSGVWFTLRSSVNCDGQELPQLPKAYVRVKDENVTVFMVKTYLVKKLGLSNEAEIDIFCMGKKLQYSQTLKYVQDAIWLPRLVESVSSRSELIQDYSDGGMSSNHLMSLHYGRRCLLN